MKKITFLFLLLSSTMISAANLLVKEYGVNNTYPTIQAAIDAASHGDSIIVYDKPSGMYWEENIVVDKVVHIVNADGLRQNLNGDIKVEPIPGDIHTFIGVDLLSGHKFYTEYSIDSLTERCTINIIDCTANTVNMDDDGLYVRLISNSIGTIYFKHGLMIDNTGNYFDITSEQYNENDSLLIIGNRNYRGQINTNASLRIFNNYFLGENINSPAEGQTCGNYNNCYSTTYTTSLSIDNFNQNPNVINYIANNSFLSYINQYQTQIYTGSNYMQHYATRSTKALNVNYSSNLMIYNNVFDTAGNTSTEHIAIDGNGGGTPFVSHNYCEMGIIEIPINNEFNHYGSYSVDGSGRCSGDCVDGGIYLGKYNDIDGTRNDAGTYGGSYSIDNYLEESEGKARVYYIDMTNFLTSPNNISIKGGGATIH